MVSLVSRRCVASHVLGSVCLCQMCITGDDPTGDQLVPSRCVSRRCLGPVQLSYLCEEFDFPSLACVLILIVETLNGGLLWRNKLMINKRPRSIPVNHALRWFYCLAKQNSKGCFYRYDGKRTVIELRLTLLIGPVTGFYDFCHVLPHGRPTRCSKVCKIRSVLKCIC